MKYRNNDGGPGSGNWGHAGRPGERGGSASAMFFNATTGMMEKHGLSSDKGAKKKMSGKAFRLSTPEGGWTGLVGAYKENLGKHPAPKKAAPKVSFKDAAKALNDKCKAEKRRPTMEECKEIGKTLVAEFEAEKFHGATKELSEQYKEGIKDFRELEKGYKSGAVKYEKYAAKYYEVMDVKKKLDEAGKKDTEWLKNKLADVRHLGINGEVGDVIALKGKKPGKAEKAIIDALSIYPTSWIEAAKNAGGSKLRATSTKGRAYYSPVENKIHVDSEHSTAIHEVIHWFERKTGRVSKAEKAFYDDRTAGEAKVSLKKLTGLSYKPTEMTKPDKFVEPYMGKDYGGHAFELLSMGCEYAYTQPHVLAKDPDMQAWVFGCLACL